MVLTDSLSCPLLSPSKLSVFILHEGNKGEGWYWLMIPWYLQIDNNFKTITVCMKISLCYFAHHLNMFFIIILNVHLNTPKYFTSETCSICWPLKLDKFQDWAIEANSFFLMFKVTHDSSNHAADFNSQHLDEIMGIICRGFGGRGGAG